MLTQVMLLIHRATRHYPHFPPGSSPHFRPGPSPPRRPPGPRQPRALPSPKAAGSPPLRGLPLRSRPPGPSHCSCPLKSPCCSETQTRWSAQVWRCGCRWRGRVRQGEDAEAGVPLSAGWGGGRGRVAGRARAARAAGPACTAPAQGLAPRPPTASTGRPGLRGWATGPAAPGHLLTQPQSPHCLPHPAL